MNVLDPAQAFMWQSLSLATFCVLETGFTHILGIKISTSAFLGRDVEEVKHRADPHEATGLLKS